MTSNSNRIPGDEGTSFRTWKIPEIDGGKILPSSQKEARERREREARERGEVIGEDVNSETFNGPITAAELARITEQAHQEGYAAGFAQGHAEGVKTGSAEGERAAYGEAKEKLTQYLDSFAHLVDGLNDPFESQTDRTDGYSITS